MSSKECGLTMITEQEARKMFKDPIWVRVNRLWNAGENVFNEAYPPYTPYTLEKVGKLRNAAYWMRDKFREKYGGVIPDSRAVNFGAKDRPGFVYCFVLTRNEIWVYDGINCPDNQTAERLFL